MAKRDDDLLILSEHGYRINTDLTDMVIISVPETNIMNRTGDLITLFGYGCVFFYKNKKGNELQSSLIISTLFESRPTAINDSGHYPGYVDLVFDKDSYVAYSENPIKDISSNKMPVIKDSTNVELMFNKLNAGKFSEYISYDQQIYVILNNLNLNQHLDRIPLLFYEMRIAKGFIDEQGNEYRIKLSGKAKPVSLLVSAMTSDTFSSVTHQDAKTSLMISLNDKGGHQKSHLEKYAFM